ncbi:MAG: ribonuclease III [Chloroflexi bacterium RBG_16_54_18]|nr:MAG: ribonuclease III [Chloroflexi bacterium RBG_16_54_18]
MQGEPKVESPEILARRLNISFTNLSVLRRALTHRSFLNENPEMLEDNERLEFLGDAVLDFLVGAWLYNNFPELAEGDLTRMRSALVRTEQLAEFARVLDLGSALKLGRGEGLGGGRDRQILLCGAFEALVGALYLDQGFLVVQDFIEPLLVPAARQVIEKHKDRDPKSQLQEIVQSQGFSAPQYRVVAAIGPEHEKSFEVEVVIGGKVQGFGHGHSKRSASKLAAQQALENLGFGDR